MVIKVDNVLVTFHPEAPQQVRDCCDLYSTTYGCELKDKCDPKECDHYKRVVSKIAPPEKKKRKYIPKIRRCECGKMLRPYQRQCDICTSNK